MVKEMHLIFERFIIYSGSWKIFSFVSFKKLEFWPLDFLINQTTSGKIISVKEEIMKVPKVYLANILVV